MSSLSVWEPLARSSGRCSKDIHTFPTTRLGLGQTTIRTMSKREAARVGDETLLSAAILIKLKEKPWASTSDGGVEMGHSLIMILILPITAQTTSLLSSIEALPRLFSPSPHLDSMASSNKVLLLSPRYLLSPCIDKTPQDTGSGDQQQRLSPLTYAANPGKQFWAFDNGLRALRS